MTPLMGEGLAERGKLRALADQIGLSSMERVSQAWRAARRTAWSCSACVSPAKWREGAVKASASAAAAWARLATLSNSLDTQQTPYFAIGTIKELMLALTLSLSASKFLMLVGRVLVGTALGQMAPKSFRGTRVAPENSAGCAQHNLYEAIGLGWHLRMVGAHVCGKTQQSFSRFNAELRTVLGHR